MKEPIFARIEDGQVVQYPMTYDDINERNTPNDVYYQCFFSDDDSPLIPSLSERVTEKLTIVGTSVYVSKTLVKKTITDMFTYLYDIATVINEEGVVSIDRSKVSTDVYLAFEDAIKAEVQKKLDDFAREKGYDDLRSASAYTNSNIEVYRTESIRACELRDLTWYTLYVYFNDVITGVRDLPVTWNDIAQNLPELTWTTTQPTGVE